MDTTRNCTTCRLSRLLLLYVATVLVFIVAKVVFMLCNHEAADALTAADMLSVVWHGLSLDLSTAIYIIVVPLLLALASMWWQHKALGVVFKVYAAIIALAFALAFVADTSLYEFWGFKLNASCLEYLAQPEGMTQSVSTGYLLVRLLLIAVLTFGLYKMYVAISRVKCGRRNIGRVAETVLYLVSMPLLVIGIRGGVTESTTNIGQVYYSQNQFLNHAAVNPVFSFLYSLSHQMGDVSQYQFMDEAECRQLLANVYTTESRDIDTLLTTTRPDIVVILLESCGEEFSEVMPHLQQLKHEGIYFSRCYANSWRTDRGTVCALSGYPSFPTLSVMKMPEKSRTLPGIARTLQAQGYSTSYIYGGDINFTNMRSYLIATGWERLTSMDDYSLADRNSAQWGVRDDITFRTVYDEIMAFQPGTSNLIGYSTLSSHEPWDVPAPAQGEWQTHSDEVLNAFAYLDYCLYSFISSLRNTPQWDNLLIVLVPDHGINYQLIDNSTPLLKHHIPMLWLGGAVREPQTIETLCNQTDLAATLLGQLQLPHDDFAFSRDVLSATYTYPTAVNNYSNAQMLIDSTGCILYDFDADRFIVDQSTDPERLLRLNKAILQTTTNDLSKRR